MKTDLLTLEMCRWREESGGWKIQESEGKETEQEEYEDGDRDRRKFIGKTKGYTFSLWSRRIGR